MQIHSQNTDSRRRGAVAVFALVMLVVLLGFASLTIDVGTLYNARADLQNAADAAALAAASSLAEDQMLEVRITKQLSASTVASDASKRAVSISSKLVSVGNKSVGLGAEDIVMGRIDLNSSNSAIDPTADAHLFNAITVSARRTSESANGAVDLFFASIWGKSTANVTASATAAFDDRVGGYDPGAGGADLFPMTINEQVYDDELAKNTDAYEFDDQIDSVSKVKDGIPEINLYPLSDTPGNFGLLNVGLSNNGTGGVGDHILHGIPAEDLEEETGADHLDFYDENGDLTAVAIPGTPGLKASLESDIEQRVGDIVGVPVFSSVSGTGANTKYGIVGIRFVRIMAVSLKSGSKYMWVQPVSYSGKGLIMDSNAKSSNGAAGQVVLVR